MAFKRFTEEDLGFLETILDNDQISTGESNLHLHSADQAYHKGYLPDVIVWPRSTDDVAAVMKMAHERSIPVTPWGAGTSLEGNCVAVHGGIVLDFQQMDRIVNIREKDFQVDVQPGVTHNRLNRELGRRGLFFPPDPGADATIGGMVANNASGIRTIKYGATRENVLRCEAVLPDGEVIRVGSWATKSSSGYDMVRLFTGSEGTLAVMTEITLKLAGIPEHFSAGVAAFDSVEAAAEAVYGIMSYGLTPAALELLDAKAIDYINRDGKIRLEAKTTLFIEFTGSNADSLAGDLSVAGEICASHGCVPFRSGVGIKERNALWQARHHFGESLIRCNPGKDVLIMDTAVPLSQFPAMVAFATHTADDVGLDNCVSAHAGDGNLHLNIVGDMQNADFVRRLNSAYDKVVSFAISVGGTATGEHGIGIGKRKFMTHEHGRGMALMQRIKQLLDPKGILNPGKIFPEID